MDAYDGPLSADPAKNLTSIRQREPSVRAHPGLLGLCVGLAVAEIGLLAALGARSALALAPQVTALAPFGVLHDLRWLFVFSNSWLTLAAEVLAFLAVRTAITAATVRLAWPTDVPRPPMTTLVTRALGSTVAAAVLLALSASLLVGMAVASVSYLFFAAVPLALIVAVLLHHGPVCSWWRHHPTLRTVGWTVTSFVVLTAGGGVIAVGNDAPGLSWVPAVLATAAVVGLFNAWAWLGVVRSLAARTSTRFVPLAPLGVGALAVVVIVGISLALSLQNRHGPLPRERATEAASDPNAQPVLVITGYASHWRGVGDRLAIGPGFVQERFSYAGLDAHGRPQRFVADDTDQALPALVRLFAQQVRSFADRTGRPVDVLSDSEGALVAKAYLLTHPDAPVRTLVLTSPLVQPGRAYFPPAGKEGYGIAAGWGLRGVGAALRAISSLDLSPDGPFVRSIDDHAPALRSALECGLPHTAQLALFPLADAVAAPYDDTSDVQAAVVPAFHGKLFDDADSLRIVGDYLRTGIVPGYRTMRLTERVVRAAAAAWQAPSLPMSINPAWRGSSGPSDCASTTARLRSWLAGSTAP